ncbi:glycosyltransferase [Actinobaculum sp. 352]|nr:glycosyltransferase family 1 protein [Actinobaculum sp. 313]RTE48315.1 glycosyltransferase [Actinobaculum sp. 352]
MPDLILERYSLFSSVLAILCGDGEWGKNRHEGGERTANGTPRDEEGVPPVDGSAPFDIDVPPVGGDLPSNDVPPVGVLEVNAPLIDEQRTHRELEDEDTAWELLRRQCAAAQAVICVSDPVKRWVHTHTGSTRVHTVPNGVNTERIRPQPEASGPAIVTFVGTLKPWHGVADLLRAANVAKGPWRLRIIGNGPERDRLERLARQLRVDTDFRGAVSPARIPEHLAGTAIGVAPYPEPRRAADHYFSPLKVHEYLAAGLPVVASAVGQLPELLRGVGLLVPPSDPRALAAALDYLAINPQERARLGRLARQRAERQHSWSVAVDRILRLAGLHETDSDAVAPPAVGNSPVGNTQATSNNASGDASPILYAYQKKGDA